MPRKGYLIEVTTLTLDLPDAVAALLGDQAHAENAPLEEIAIGAIIGYLRESRPAALVDAVSRHLAQDLDHDVIEQLRGRG
jgi:hypothetical protein